MEIKMEIFSGLSFTVVGYRPVDQKYIIMKAIWDNCKAVNIPVPDEVEQFFNYEDPTDKGVPCDIEFALERYMDYETGEGIDIALDKIPKDIKIIRIKTS